MFTSANAAAMSRRGNKQAGGKARAAQFTRESQRAAFDGLIAKYGRERAMRILADAIAKRPRTEPEDRMEDVLAGMGLDYKTDFVAGCGDAAYAVDFF